SFLKRPLQAKGKRNEVDAINMQRLHLMRRDLDQDKVQLTFILEVIGRLRRQRNRFYRLARRVLVPEDRDWLYIRVGEELDRLEN
ncbi:hypothetical protein P280DRAFT_408555, partial [Massarina eburnea CBS 473.64]